MDLIIWNITWSIFLKNAPRLLLFTMNLYVDRQGLIRGDPDTIHPILTWLLSNADTVRKRAYLSRFLVKVYTRFYTYMVKMISAPTLRHC